MYRHLGARNWCGEPQQPLCGGAWGRGLHGNRVQDEDGELKGHLAAFQIWNGDGEAHLNKKLDGNFFHFPLSLIPTRFLLGE